MTRLDRRALFTSGAAAALLAASGLSAQARPARGGRLRVALSREDDSLGRFVRGAVFETLTEVAPDGVLRGRLATGWQGSADAKSWEISLRGGVEFHDGRRLTAETVLAALRGHELFGPGLARAGTAGPLTLRLELGRGNPDLPYLLSDPAFVIQGAGGAGTGLYVPRRLQAERHFLGRRVDRHYLDGQAGWADAVDAIVIPGAAVRAEALREGYVDVAELPAPQGLLGRGDFVYRPSARDMALAARRGVGIPRVIGSRATLDDGRLAERWWLA